MKPYQHFLLGLFYIAALSCAKSEKGSYEYAGPAAEVMEETTENQAYEPESSADEPAETAGNSPLVGIESVAPTKLPEKEGTENLFGLNYLGFKVPSAQQRLLAKSATVEAKVDKVLDELEALKNFNAALGGYTLNNKLTGERYELDSRKESEDSSLVLYESAPKAVLRLRLPADKLDTLLAFVNRRASAVVLAEVEVEDLTLPQLQNLEEAKVESEMAAMEQSLLGKKEKNSSLEETVSATEQLRNQKLALVRQRAVARDLFDRVAFADVSMTLDGPAKTWTERVANQAQQLPEPGMMAQVGSNMAASLRHIALVISYVLPMALFIGLGWWGFKALAKRRRKKSS